MSTIDDVATLELPFKAPFNWPRLLRFFGGRATPGVEAMEDGTYRRAIDWLGDSGTLTVRQHPRKRCIVAQIEGPVSRRADALAAPITKMFDLRADPKKIGTELVVRAIVGQQVSVKAATTIIGRLVQRAGERIESHPNEDTAWRFPTPAALAAVDLVKISMPGKRVAALQGFAHAVATGDVPIDSNVADTTALRKAMRALPGIGPWTVEYVAMRVWRDPDTWPAWDDAIDLRARPVPRAAHAAARAPTTGGRGAPTQPCTCGTRLPIAQAAHAAAKLQRNAPGRCKSRCEARMRVAGKCSRGGEVLTSTSSRRAREKPYRTSASVRSRDALKWPQAAVLARC
ncbi:MAG: DNA-3-methyladenine glycosylase II (EC [uncultured Paraburkholderia sp.]|nr:MAG: DNA-3-methyladenine glycosylase II (EC [uncultured Paraburkholderia sp.]CAH2944066.1 MAG: DNA-3-methyladenine glycosylase II (EC [uncultured Paraburkholderia sp.]